jgi:hypothetical protein
MSFQVGNPTSNLNAYFSGNVGFGSTLPTSKIDVIGDGEFTGIVTARAFTGTSGISSFLSGTTVFIGAASSTGTAGQVLQVAGAGGSSVYIGGNVSIGVTIVTSPAAVSIAGTLGISEINGTGSRTLFGSSAQGFSLNHNDNSPFVMLFQSAEKLRINNTGNVGIGTTLNLTAALVTVNGGLLITNSSNTIGYGTGTGGVVTQLTGKTTGVTLSRPSGDITLALGQMTTGIVSTFTLTNTVIGATDVLILNHISGGTLGAYTLNASASAGTAQINIRNVTAGTLNEQPVIRFVVIKGANS